VALGSSLARKLDDMIDLADLHNRHRSTRGFVVGTGMSVSILLDEFRVSRERFVPEIVVGCKQAHRRLPLRYWVSMDSSFYEREKTALAGTGFVKFIPAGTSSDEPEHDRTVVPLSPLSKAKPADSVPSEFGDLSIEGDTGVVALRIAYLLGLDPIYLVGLADRIYDGKMHFHAESKRVVSDMVVSAMSTELFPFIQAIRARGVTVASCSPISNLNGIVPYVDIRTLLSVEESGQ
jgi:hypothetical protein